MDSLKSIGIFEEEGGGNFPCGFYRDSVALMRAHECDNLIMRDGWMVLKWRCNTFGVQQSKTAVWGRHGVGCVVGVVGVITAAFVAITCEDVSEEVCDQVVRIATPLRPVLSAARVGHVVRLERRSASGGGALPQQLARIERIQRFVQIERNAWDARH